MRNETSRAMIELEKRGVRLSVNDGRLRFAGADVEDSELVKTVRAEEIKVACEVLWGAERERLDALYPPALVRAAHKDITQSLNDAFAQSIADNTVEPFEGAVAEMRRYIGNELAPAMNGGAS